MTTQTSPASRSCWPSSLACGPTAGWNRIGRLRCLLPKTAGGKSAGCPRDDLDCQSRNHLELGLIQPRWRARSGAGIS